ncbi:hypothetical protein LSH36_363g01019 [Paralvinella palmiformis]|uniref:Aryl hydrocarbon receptor nuclear translocator n=1 Tax=Paralvinella palmiformis TaxID=53620 RepID=A0AAD9N0Z0_9ANNE|nr:hypothetical protein LSH36_363g01019 [Paralvinella palmiformis]
MRLCMGSRRGFIIRMKIGNMHVDPMTATHTVRIRQRNTLGPSNDGHQYAVVHVTGYIKNWPPAGKSQMDRGDSDEPHATHCCLVAIGRLQVTSTPNCSDMSNSNSATEFISRHAIDGKFTFVDQSIEAERPGDVGDVSFPSQKSQNSSGAASDQSSDPSAVNNYQRTGSDINSSLQTDRPYTDMYRGIMPAQMGNVSMTSMGNDLPAISHRNSPDDTSLYGRSTYRSSQASDYPVAPPTSYSQMSPNSGSSPAAPTYTQLGGRGAAQSQGSSYSSSVWPQWQPGSDSSQGQSGSSTQPSQPSGSQQSTAQQVATGGAAAATQPRLQQPAGGGQQQEELSDMLRMLDNPGTDFNDLSGMFNTFTE